MRAKVKISKLRRAQKRKQEEYIKLGEPEDSELSSDPLD